MVSSAFHLLAATECWYVRDLQISLIMCRASNPLLTNSSVSRSSSFGFVGGLPARMSSIGSISPVPSMYAQSRLTLLLAKYWFSFDVIHFAIWTRREAVAGARSECVYGKDGGVTWPVRACVTSPLLTSEITSTSGWAASTLVPPTFWLRNRR